MKKFLFIALAISSQSMAQHLNYESHYQHIHCNAINGSAEVSINGSRRIDCLTGKYAIEHDFASKAYECVGQALYYSVVKQKIPVCALILESENDERYLDIISTIQEIQPNLQLVKLYPNANGVRCESENKKLCGNL